MTSQGQSPRGGTLEQARLGDAGDLERQQLRKLYSAEALPKDAGAGLIREAGKATGDEGDLKRQRLRQLLSAETLPEGGRGRRTP